MCPYIYIALQIFQSNFAFNIFWNLIALWNVKCAHFLSKTLKTSDMFLIIVKQGQGAKSND